MLSKAKCQRMHTKTRMLQRYGIELNRRSYQEIANPIRDRGPGKAKDSRFVDRQSNRITRWFVKYSGRWFPVVYDSKRKTLVTILPEGSLGPEPKD